MFDDMETVNKITQYVYIFFSVIIDLFIPVMVFLIYRTLKRIESKINNSDKKD